jgi:hypothetical protein
MAQLDRLLIFGEATFTEIEACDSFGDFVTGCGSTMSSVMTSLVLGTIPGPNWAWLALLNTSIVVVYFSLVIFSVYRHVRGMPDE